MATKRIHLKSQEEALVLFGQNDQYLRDLERRYHVQFFIRPSSLPSGEGLTLAMRGRAPDIDKVIAALEARRMTPGLPAKMPDSLQVSAAETASREIVVRTVTGGAIVPRTSHQKEYIQAMREYDMVLGLGPAGTGKTFLAVAYAVSELQAGRVTRIVLTRPVVEAGEKLGFLPGDFYDKVHPYLRPLYDAFFTIVGPDRFRLLKEDEVIEIVPLAYMRGRTLDDALIILDEAQNTTPEQMKMFLTRMGQHSKVIINGDLTQIDLENKRRSGLLKIERILHGIEGVGMVRFSSEDVVRHQLVQKIIQAYEEFEREESGQARQATGG
ncbi:MAG: PhoH-like protein [Elusimicrobia bacterium]|nr:PhoH-like protein [Elusimicrobiota bacterium]